MNGQQVYVVTAVLKLNGETVRTYQWQAGEPQVSSVTLAVMFDSSHFAHDSTVTVEFVFVDSLGRWFNDDMQAPVKNRLISYGHHEPGHQPRPAPIAGSAMSGKNYGITVQDAGGWTGPQMLADMDGATAVHYSGHGLTNAYMDDVDLPVYAIGSVQTPAVEGFRALQMGSGHPPFNSTHAPPIHFAYLNTCYPATTNNFVRFCIPYLNGYGQWLENQAVMAHSASMLTSENAGRTKEIWEPLAESRTVSSARNQLLFHVPPFHFETPSGPQPIGIAQVPIYGDLLTKLSGVYSPIPVASGAWYRAL